MKLFNTSTRGTAKAVARIELLTQTSEVIMLKWTYQQRLNNECTHHEYFLQFVTDATFHMLESSPRLMKRILNSSDQRVFKDIPCVSVWYDLPRAYNLHGIGWCPSTHVCILKAAARELVKKHKGQ